MKIAIVTETFLPSVDGIVTRLCATIKWLQGNGHQVCVIAPELGVKEYAGAVIRGIPARTFFFYRDRQFSLPNSKVGKYLAEFQPDVVHVVNPALLGVSGIYYSWRLGLPTLASYHTNVPQYSTYYKLPFLQSVLWWYVRTLHNRADLNLCTSLTVKNELEARGFRRVQLWNRGVDVDKFGPQFHDDEMRKRLTNNQTDKILLLYVGRLAPEKGIDKLREILRVSDDFCLAIVGDGPNRAMLTEYFRGTNTVFIGFLHGEHLSKAYASSDVFVFPSTTETLGLVLLEAMASGLPVVAADSGPTREQVRSGFSGLLYDPHNSTSLSDTVIKLKDEQLRKTLAANAYNSGHKLSWARPSEQLLQFYQQVLDKFHSHRAQAV